MLFWHLYPLIFHVHEKWFMDEMTRERFRIISVTKDECLFIQALRLIEKYEPHQNDSFVLLST